MGKKAKWFSSVKKAFSPDSKKSKHRSPESPNGVISILPPLLDNARHSPPPPPLEVRVAEVVVERNINLSPPFQILNSALPFFLVVASIKAIMQFILSAFSVNSVGRDDEGNLSEEEAYPRGFGLIGELFSGTDASKNKKDREL
ncbi:hypothetical protein Rs2_29069 [Raphanus sativus]|nr:hypothetical protein Rs2_29069 [Raphanus sativus]